MLRGVVASLSARRAWIEISIICCEVVTPMSLSARRAWIEIRKSMLERPHCRSLSARRAWIEIQLRRFCLCGGKVALRKESVDRNNSPGGDAYAGVVALRKESVDRNAYPIYYDVEYEKSLSARRAWIEILCIITQPRPICSRSPQGERG